MSRGRLGEDRGRRGGTRQGNDLSAFKVIDGHPETLANWPLPLPHLEHTLEKVTTTVRPELGKGPPFKG
jgi:hypothetical protein